MKERQDELELELELSSQARQCSHRQLGKPGLIDALKGLALQ